MERVSPSSLYAPRFAPFPVRNLALAGAAGILGGLASSALLISLGWVAKTQTANPNLLYFLPVAGLVVGGLYDRFAKRAAGGTHLILDELHEPTEIVPARMAPLIFITSLISHLFGASVGREGIAVQMGASLSDQLGNFFGHSKEERRTILRTGMAAGFAGALGAPLAGLVFGMEVLRFPRRFTFIPWIECGISAGIAVLITRALGVHHTVYGILPPTVPLLSISYVFAALVFGAVTGLLVRIFIVSTELTSHLWTFLFKSHAARTFTGGVLLIGLVLLFGNRESTGLGLPQIQAAFIKPAVTSLSFEKLVLTVVSIGTGFKGGEFIPLVFIGATLCSSIAFFFSVPLSYAAACGVSSSFGAAARVPLALSVFAAEHFGYRIFIYALLANLAARLVAGKNLTIYPSQKNVASSGL